MFAVSIYIFCRLNIADIVVKQLIYKSRNYSISASDNAQQSAANVSIAIIVIFHIKTIFVLERTLHNNLKNK